MSNRLRDALNQVQAGEELKEKTKEYLYRENKRLYPGAAGRLPSVDSGGCVCGGIADRRQLAVFYAYGSDQHGCQSLHGAGRETGLTG